MIQRVLVVFIAIMSLIVVATLAALVWFWGAGAVASPTTNTTTTTLIPDWVAVTVDGELQLHRNGQTQTLRDDAFVGSETLPSMSPDGTQIAYVRHANTQIAVSVYTLANASLTDIYTSDTQEMRMLHWSPDGRHIAFVTSDDAVIVAPSDGVALATKVAQGGRSFVDWSPTSAALLVRIGILGRDGGMLGVYDVQKNKIVMSHADVGDFQSAQWDQTGTGYFYVVDATGADGATSPAAVIRYQRLDGTYSDIVNEGPATIRLLPAPASNQLAYIVARADQRLLRVWRNGAVETLSETQPLTAWWSPDARLIAMMTIVDDQSLRWEVIDTITGQVQQLSTFMPNDATIDVLRYFDGEAYSPWSSDGQWLLMTSRDIVQAQAVGGGGVVPLGPGVHAQWVATNLVR